MKKIGFAVLLLGSFAALQSCDTASYAADDNTYYSNPGWAPAYSAGTRYYYLPDIETYYDLRSGDFVYLDNGMWLYSNSLPPYYSAYDLNNGYVVVLNNGVYQPWMHHQNYVSHYPRYYYQSVPNPSNGRVFNENKTVNKPRGQRSTTSPQTPEPINKPRRTGQTTTPQTGTPEKMETPRQPQPSRYYGRDIGKPVKVTPEMKKAQERSTPQAAPQQTAPRNAPQPKQEPASRQNPPQKKERGRQ